MSSRSIQELYNAIDATSSRLRQMGCESDADRISYALHNVAWTSSTELLKNLKELFEELLSNTRSSKLDDEMRDEINDYITAIEAM